MTTSVKIYHNPKCSKSRSALELIQQKQLTVEIIEYLKFPPHSKELADIIKKLGVTAREIIRKNDYHLDYNTGTVKPKQTDLFDF